MTNEIETKVHIGSGQLENEDVYTLIRNIRSRWGNSDFDFDRATRVLALALLQCSEKVIPAVEATIEELSTRETYRIIKEVL